jgi:hypothetical protein
MSCRDGRSSAPAELSRWYVSLALAVAPAVAWPAETVVVAQPATRRMLARLPRVCCPAAKRDAVAHRRSAVDTGMQDDRVRADDGAVSVPPTDFRGSMRGPCSPPPTLRLTPHDVRRTTKGQCGSLLLHCEGLSPSIPCRSPGAHWVRFATATFLRRLIIDADRPAALERAGRGTGMILLGENDFEPWLSGSAGLELLKPAANNLRSE